MALTVIGVSHQTAPLAVRERLAYSPGDLPESLSALRAAAGASEAVLLSTCNRTELFLVEGEVPAAEAVHAAWAGRLGGDARTYLYVRRDREAVAHLFRVAAGLDSMIVGEAQIQGQVRDAWERSRPHAGAVLNRLFQTALAVASRVREETAVGRGAASVSSAAVQLAKQIFGSLVGRRAMILGAGEMAELALECLVREGVRTALVANRSHERAAEVAARHGATAIRYEDAWARLADVDVLLSSTAAPHPVVSPRSLEAGLAGRGDRPLCILDIAVPRDVEPAVRELANVFLYDLDDLRAAAAATLERRRAELPTAEGVIAEEVERYWEWLAGLAAVPVLTRFRTQMDRIRRDEVEHAMRKLAHLPPAERETIEHLSRALMNKFLHEPSVRLRASAANGRGLGIVDALRYLFALDDDAEARGGATADREPDA